MVLCVAQRMALALFVLGLMMSGCQAAKDAVEEASGFAMLDDGEIEGLLNNSNWKQSGADSKFKVHFGFRLSEKFGGNIGSKFSQTIPGLPADAKTASDGSGKPNSLAIIKHEEFSIPNVNTFHRFMIANVARINDEDQLEVGADEISQYMNAADRISKDNENQSGQYLVVSGAGAAMTFLHGGVSLKKAGATESLMADDPVGGALVFTDSSPFVSRSGADGRYMVGILEGAKGTALGYRQSMSTLAEGTPDSTSTDIPYAGVIPDEEKAKATDKTSEINAKLSANVASWADEANTKVTDLLGLWKLQNADLQFVQPPKEPQPLPEPDAGTGPDTPTEDTPADPPPPEDSPVMRRPPDAAETVNVDLGCTGVRGDAGETDTLITEGEKFDDFDGTPGWRIKGDVRITTEAHTAIFGDPADGALAGEARYLDKMQGYCLLTTGDALYQKAGKDGLKPENGQVSEMWQRVSVPTDAKSIQVRVAFFSQEYPAYVGTTFNDGFFIKFDESTEMIASGTLNDLGGGEKVNSGATGGTCKVDTIAKGAAHDCGEWRSIAADSDLSGELWNVADSTQAPGYGSSFNCLDDDSDNGDSKCYHGWIPPQVICKTLADHEKGKNLILRINVHDKGDAYFDSALAVDSIVFSTEGCNAGELFSGDRASRVSEVPPSD